MSGVGELETEEKECREPSERLHGVVGGETYGDEHQQPGLLLLFPEFADRASANQPRV